MDVDKIIKELSQNEKKVLLTLKKLSKKASPDEIVKSGDFSQEVEVMNASSWLQSKKLVKIDEHIKTTYQLGKEGKKFLEKGLPEKQALIKINENKGFLPLKDLTKFLEKGEVPIAIGWLKKKNWATIKKDKETILEITEEGKKALEKGGEDEKILKLLSEKESAELKKDKIKSLLSRQNVVKEKEIIFSSIELTELGKKILDKGFEIKEEISQITSNVIKNKEWETKAIRPYDIDTFAPALHGGKPHPLVKLIDDIRQIFVEMGFQEIQGNYVESCFWNMDVLFIPQDHPARDLQDTLYLKNPKKMNIEENKLLEKIGQIHKDGGKTGSTGWGYNFSNDEGKRALLRTHTTVNTIRYLYNNPKTPSKVFSLGRVFRKESIDATHLPEFYQIEGIINEENATFSQLLGTIKEFYKRMGFEKIRFRPGYFPYTEPSMEVEVFWNNEWMELGGSGIFRPEVTKPLGIKNPVLAWGLGLERLAMLKFKLKDMRNLYNSDLEWLRNEPLL